MKKHMQNMKMNMGQLKHKMDAAQAETERQVRFWRVVSVCAQRVQAACG